MNRNFSAHQTEAMAQLHSSGIISNIRHTQESNSSSEISMQSIEDNQASILKDTKDKSNTLSHIRRIKIPNELLDSTEEQILKN